MGRPGSTTPVTKKISPKGKPGATTPNTKKMPPKGRPKNAKDPIQGKAPTNGNKESLHLNQQPSHLRQQLRRHLSLPHVKETKPERSLVCQKVCCASSRDTA